MYVSQRIEIKPNKTTIKLFENYFNYNRYCYNKALENWNNLYKQFKNKEIEKRPNSRRVRDHLKSIKEDWEKDYSPIIIETACEDVDRAFKFFWKGLTKFPKFKSKKNKNIKFSFRYQRKNPSTFRIKDEKRLFLQRFPYPIKMTEKIRFDGLLKTLTISKKANRYFATFVIDINPSYYQNFHPNSNDKNICGIDLGVKTLAIIADNKFENNKKFYKCKSIIKDIEKYYKKISYYDKRMSKKIYGSKKYEAMRIKLQKIYNRIHNLEYNYIHKFTKRICRRYKYICIENLKSKNLQKRHSLARNIRNSLFYSIRKQFEYKSQFYNCILIKADRFFPSTQMSSCCGNILKGKDKLKLKSRKYKCKKCGLIRNRDLNAAINLRNYGKQWARL